MRVMMVGTDLSNKGGIASVVRTYFDAGLAQRLGIRYYPTHIDGTKVQKLLFYLKGVLRIFCHLAAFEVVHVHMSYHWSFRRLCPVVFGAKLLGKYSIIHLHGGRFGDYYRKASTLERFLIEKAFGAAQKVVVLSADWRHMVRAFCPIAKSVVIPNCTAIPDLSEEIVAAKCDSPRIILFLGRLSQAKGIYDLIAATAGLNREHGSFMVLICGDGEIEKARKRIEAHDLEAIMKLPGWIGADTKKELLQQAYMVVLPSYVEALPMSLIEAMATATPVVTTPVGGIPDLVEDGREGLMVAPGDVAGLQAAMGRLLTDRDLWVKMSRASRRKIESGYTLETLATKLEELYRGAGPG